MFSQEMLFYTTKKLFFLRSSYFGLFKKKIHLILKLAYGPELILFKMLAFMSQKIHPL